MVGFDSGAADSQRLPDNPLICGSNEIWRILHERAFKEKATDDSVAFGEVALSTQVCRQGYVESVTPRLRIRTVARSEQWPDQNSGPIRTVA